VRIYYLSDWLEGKLQRALRTAFTDLFRMEKKAQTIGVLDSAASTIIATGVLGYGAFLAITGQATLGAVLASTRYVSLGVHSLWGLSGLYMHAKPLSAYEQRIARLLDLPTEFGVGTAVPSRLDSVEMDGISFEYGATSPPILCGASMRLSRGKTALLIGPSGSGKTTTGLLLCGLLQPNRGAIRVNGKSLSLVSYDWYRQTATLVSGNDYVFSATLLDNILLGRHASHEKLQECVHLSLLESLQERLPEGLHTRVGLGGFSLSSGERQRLAIARVLIRDPQFVVLDEATSGLDMSMEQELYRRLEGWLENRVALVISHRPEPALFAGEVLVLEDGHITRSGNVPVELERETV
jgi:ABC-type bacteriocin/lantibiotic exporter with double-glycine peptidase domain